MGNDAACSRIIGIEDDIVPIGNGDHPGHHSIPTAKGFVDIVEVFAIPPNSNRDNDHWIGSFNRLIISL